MKHKSIFILLVVLLFGFNAQVFAGNLTDRLNYLEDRIKVLQKKVDTMQGKSAYQGNRLELDTLVEMYAHGPAIVTSPALGVRRSADDGGDLMISLSSIHEDLVLLRLRQNMDNYARAHKIPIPQRPIIALSGGIEGLFNNIHGYDRTDRADINLSRAELNIVGEAGPWATASMIISYDDKAPDSGKRVDNSRLKIDRAFLTIAQLNKCPLYFTVGQIFAPFGKYSSYMVTDSPTKLLGRIKDRMAVLGFAKDNIRESGFGVSAQVYGFSGETKVKNRNIRERGGFNLDLDYAKNKFKFNLGGGVIGNMAETDGMQAKIFKADDQDKRIDSRVFGVNGHIKAIYDMFTVLAEYSGAGKHFDKKDLSFNDRGAKPMALNVEGAVDFKVLDKLNTFALGYAQTWQALALGLPRNTFFVEHSISVWKNTILSLEYRHDINYNWRDSGKAGELDEVRVDGQPNRHKNTVTAKLGVYF